MLNPMNDAPNVHTAYMAGREDTYPNHHIMEIAQAIKAWKFASTDHAETSFFGVENIRKMRAYWLGRARGLRARKGYGG